MDPTNIAYRELLKMPPIILRCQASPTIGLGHLMRCRELARILKERGRDCVLIGPQSVLLNQEDRLLFQALYPVENYGGTATDLKLVLSIARKHGASFVVMDDYRVDANYGFALKQHGIRFLQQFDSSCPCTYYADILVNSGPFEKPEHYSGFLGNPQTRLLLGPKYAVLRRDFQEIVPRPTSPVVERILVCFGGGDDRGAISLSINALLPLLAPNSRVDVISGGGNPHKERIKAAMTPLHKRGILFHSETNNVAEFMRNADLALIAGGTMSYESAICGLPSAFVAMAGNQTRSCHGWQSATGAPFLGPIYKLTSAKISEVVRMLIDDFSVRASIAAAARFLVDGKGAARIVDAIIEVERE